jgi:hypothetical protein
MVGANPGPQSKERWKEILELYRSLGLLTRNVKLKEHSALSSLASGAARPLESTIQMLASSI